MERIKKDSFGIEIENAEMGKLEWLLQEAKIPYRIEYIWGMPSVRYYGHGEELICDAVCHSGSYGHEIGLLEIMGLTRNDDSVEGWLTSEEVFDRSLKIGIKGTEKFPLKI